MSMTKGRKQAIVLCHAGFRTMNTLADVAVAEWLFDDFDVFAFDFRGHGNSGGWYSGDGKTCLDLKAVMQYIKDHYHYEKIGLMGRSLGAWSIVMKEAQDHEAAAILVAALPNHHIRDCPPLTPLYPIFVNNRLGNVIARIARGLRPRPYDVGDDPWKVIEQISPTPMLMVYCEEDSFLGMSREQGMEALFERPGTKRIVISRRLSCTITDAGTIWLTVVQRYLKWLSIMSKIIRCRTFLLVMWLSLLHGLTYSLIGIGGAVLKAILCLVHVWQGTGQLIGAIWQLQSGKIGIRQ
jgi:pimeloyl-ACP methyl ester carboxylesterase